MSNNKQSSIEWLRSLYENQPAYEECILDEEWEKAKAMHKDEIEQAIMFGNCRGQISTYATSEEYYHETFKSE